VIWANWDRCAPVFERLGLALLAASLLPAIGVVSLVVYGYRWTRRLLAQVLAPLN
jgi:hypothetical protein